MQNEKVITVRLTVNQAYEAMAACVNQRNKLDKVRQDLLNRGKPVAEIARVGRRVKDLHRAERALGEAMENA